MPEAILHFAGRYPLFVWGSWGLSAFALIWMTLDTLLRARHWRAAAERRDTSEKV
jgi:heme exporter protein CcmD